MSRAARGFTMVEMMVAVWILGLILAMLASSFSAVAHSKVHGEARLAGDEAARLIMFQMSREIRGVVQNGVAPVHVLVIGSGHMQNGSPLDNITLSTLGAGHHRAVFGPGAEDIVSYTAAANQNHRGWFVLMRTQQSGLLPPEHGAPQPPVELADNLLSLHLRYFDGTRWNESWDSRANGGGALPLAVSIDLALATPAGKPMYLSTMVPVPVVLWNTQR
ncbi:MAG: prepilin-type N-terminal cleavage/methylation domain-containing protein [Candidatus Binataceae bacterium]